MTHLCQSAGTTLHRATDRLVNIVQRCRECNLPELGVAYGIISCIYIILFRHRAADHSCRAGCEASIIIIIIQQAQVILYGSDIITFSAEYMRLHDAARRIVNHGGARFSADLKAAQ
jgi:hypothetical protein